MNAEGDHLLPSLPDNIFNELISEEIEREPEFAQVDPYFLKVMFSEYRLLLAQQYISFAMRNPGFRSYFHLPTSAQMKAMKVTRHPAYTRCVKIVSMLFAILIAFEKLKPSGDSLSMTEPVAVLSFFCVGVMFVDTILLMFTVGLRQFFVSGWNIALTLALIAQLVALFLSSPHFVWLRAGRAVLAICKTENIQSTLLAMGSTFTGVSEVLLIMLVVISVYAIVGQVLFTDYYLHIGDDLEYTKAFFFPVKEEEKDGLRTFHHFCKSFLSLFVLTTTENFPLIAQPVEMRANHFGQALGVLYFGSFIIVTIYIILKVLLAKTYDSWKDKHLELSMRSRTCQYHALLVAWHVLSDRGTGHMNLPRWKHLVQLLRPNILEEDQQAILRFMDKNKSGHITRNEFVLCAADAILFDFDKYRRLHQDNVNGIDWNIDDFQREKILWVIESKAFAVLTVASVIVHFVTIAVPIYALEDKKHYAAGFFKGIDDAKISNLKIIYVIFGYYVLVFFILEQGIKILVYRPLRSWSREKHVELAVTSIFVVASLLASINDGYFMVYSTDYAVDNCRVIMRSNTDLRESGHIDCENLTIFLRSLRVFLILRLLTVSKATTDAIFVFWDVRQVIYKFIFVAVCILYVYACIGTSLLHMNFKPYSVLEMCCSHNITVDDASVNNSIPQFGNYGQAFLALFQIMVDNNWNDILWAQYEEGQFIPRWVVGLFFGSFFILVKWFGNNILVALIIESFEVVKSNTAQQMSLREAFGGLRPCDQRNINGLISHQNSSMNCPVSSHYTNLYEGKLVTCSRCGPECSVFIGSHFDPDVCQCGHGALYHELLPDGSIPARRGEDNNRARISTQNRNSSFIESIIRSSSSPRHNTPVPGIFEMSNEQILELRPLVDELKRYLKLTEAALRQDQEKLKGHFRRIIRQKLGRTAD